MIRAMTSTCTRDIHLVARLSRQLIGLGIDHHLFIEKCEGAAFVALGFDGATLHVKPDGGDNGLGRAGSMVRWHCHQVMRSVLDDGDTYVNLDSDVCFQDEEMVADLACAEGEIKGFRGHPIAVDGTTFYHYSGMALAAHAGVFKRAMGISEGDALAACNRVLDAGHTPSEDVVASYLFQTIGGAHALTNFHASYTRGDGDHFSLRHSRT